MEDGFRIKGSINLQLNKKGVRKGMVYICH